MKIENYTDGKVRSDLDHIKELERVFGIAAISPFGTNNKEVFQEKLKSMELKAMVRLAEKLGVIRAADKKEQKKYLMESFDDWVRRNGDPIGDKVKGGRPTATVLQGHENIQKLLDKDRKLDTFEKIFPSMDSEGKFMEVVGNYTLSELRNLAARLGFNPSFDRSRLILLLKNEFNTYLRKQSVV